MKLSDTAKAYAEALPLKVISLDEVIAWADARILEQDEPDLPLIELAGCRKESEALTHLNVLSEGSDEESSIRLLFGLCHTALEKSMADYSAVAKRLFFWSMYETDLTDFGELGSFWDDLDLASEGITGHTETVKRNMLAFFDQHRL